MLHLGDDAAGSEDNLIDEISLPVSLSAGVLYIIQRFLNQVDDHDVSEDDNWAPNNAVVEVNLQVDDTDDEDRPDDSLPTSGEGDCVGDRQLEPEIVMRPSRRTRIKRYRMPWTRIRRSHTPTPDPIDSGRRVIAVRSSAARLRSRSPITRSRLSHPPNEN